MVINETGITITDVARAIYPLVSGDITPLVNIFKAAGIIIIIYILFLIIQSILKLKDRRRLKRIEEKLDILLKINEKDKKKKTKY